MIGPGWNVQLVHWRTEATQVLDGHPYLNVHATKLEGMFSHFPVVEGLYMIEGVWPVRLCLLW